MAVAALILLAYPAASHAFTVDDCSSGEAPSPWVSESCSNFCAAEKTYTLRCQTTPRGCLADVDIYAVNYTGSDESITVFGDCATDTTHVYFCCHAEDDGGAEVRQVELYGSALNDEDVSFTYGGGSYNLEYWTSGDPMHGVAYGGAGFDVMRGSHSTATTYDELLEGQDGDDVIFGNPGHDDHIRGNAGDDRIYGGNGFDRIDGGDDVDELYGGNGADWLFGGAGNDEIFGGAGNDEIWGEAGADILEGQGNADTLHGGDGNDILKGQSGYDVLFGGDGADTLHGGALADELHGGDGVDDLNGHGGNDVLYGGLGSGDSVDGGDGADVLCGTSYPENSVCPTALEFIGGNGDDKAWLEESTCTFISLSGDGTTETARDDVWAWTSFVLDPVVGVEENNSTPYAECSDIMSAFGR